LGSGGGEGINGIDREEWRRLVERAARAGKAGDLLLLAEEAPDPESSEFARDLAAVEARPGGRVLLFGGHLLDRPDRPEPRFPPDLAGRAVEAIHREIERLAGPGTIAISGGACGGDLLFAEVCLQHGIAVEVRIPFGIARFLETSVSFAGEEWTDRFCGIACDPGVDLTCMPEEVGPTPDGVDPHERANRWLVTSARGAARDHLDVLALWDGLPGEGPAGVAHLVEIVRPFATSIEVIDPHGLPAA